MSTQHTPTPWTNPTDGGVQAPAERTTLSSGREVAFRVCTMKDGDRETVRANAAFIVRACNAHDALVSALSDLEDIFDGQEDCDDGVPNDAMRAMTIIRAALAKAGAA